MKNTIKRIIITILCLLVLFMSLPTASVMGAQSPITGGDFENTVINSNSTASTGWRYNSSTKAVKNTAHAYSGEKSVKLTTTSTGYGTLSYTPITVSANSNYTFSFAIFVETAGASDFRYSLMSGTKYLENAKNITVAGTVGQWYYYEITVNSGNYTELTLRMQPYSGGVYYVDDVNLRGDTVDVDVTCTEGGYITGYNADKEYFISDILDLYAHPFADYVFSGWYQDDTLVSNDKNLNLNITQSVSLTARFEYSKFTDNRIVGGEFEENVNLNFTGENTQLFSLSNEPFAGENSLEISSGSGYIEQIFTVSKNTDYVLSLRNKKDANGVSQVQILDDTTPIVTANIGGDGQDWTANRLYFNSGDNTELSLRFTAQSGTVWVDSIVVSTPVNITVKAGSNGTVKIDGNSPYAKGETVIFTAVPDDGYRLDYWDMGGTAVAGGKTFTVTAQSNQTYTVVFVEAIYPVILDFDVEYTVCEDANNIVSNNMLQNSTTFIKDGVMTAVCDDENDCFLFAPVGGASQTVYYAVNVTPYTDYMMSARVCGEYFSTDKNQMDATFGIINPENGNFLVMENPQNHGGYYDETNNATAGKSMTPPAWDNQWHSRGMTFNSGDNLVLYIAVTGTVCRMYIDDITLCLYENAISENENKKYSYVTDTVPEKTGFDGADNLAQVSCVYGGGLFTDVGYGNYLGKNALIMRQTTPVPSAAACIQWISVKPDTHYTLSFSVAANGTASACYGLVEDVDGFLHRLWNQTVYAAGEWRCTAVSFKSGDTTEVGVYVRDVLGTVAICDIELYESEEITVESEILRGGDFETANTDAFLLSSDSGDFEITDKTVYSGKYALKIGTNNRWDNIRQDVKVEKNTEYRIVFYGRRAKLRDSAIWKLLDTKTLEPLEGLTENYYVNGSGRWQKNSLTFNSGNRESLTFYIVSDLGAAYIDDIRFLIPAYTGDADRNGYTNAGDLREVKKALIKVSLKYYDINKDDVDDIRDLIRLKKILSETL